MDRRGALITLGYGIAGSAASLAGCGKGAALAEDHVPLPAGSLDPAVPVVLRPLYLENPSQMRFSTESLERMLAQTVLQVRLHLGQEIRFAPLATMPLANAFARFSTSVRQKLNPRLFDVRHATPESRKRFFAGLQKELEGQLREGGNTLASLIAYATPHLAQPLHDASLASLVQAVGETHLTRLRAALASGMLPADASEPFNEFIYWEFAQEMALSHEVVLTNQLIASAEWSNHALHTALRGGITNGVTFSNPHSALGTTAVGSLAAFFDDKPWLAPLTDATQIAPYSLAEREHFFALLLTHEIGHMLLHLGHPYGVPACVMSPTQQLHYRAWANGLDTAACTGAKNRDMAPGRVRFPRRLAL